MGRSRDLLATLAADPARVGEVRPAEVPDVLAELEALKARLYARLMTPEAPAEPKRTNGAEPDRLLTADEAADRLSVPRRWMYDHADSLPFTRRLGPGTLRFSARGLAQYIEKRRP